MIYHPADHLLLDFLLKPLENNAGVCALTTLGPVLQATRILITPKASASPAVLNHGSHPCGNTFPRSILTELVIATMPFLPSYKSIWECEPQRATLLKG